MRNRCARGLAAIVALVCLCYTALAHAAAVTIALATGLALDIPGNWTTIVSGKQVAVDTLVQETASGQRVVATNPGVPFVATLLNKHGQMSAMLTVRQESSSPVNQIPFGNLTDEQIAAVDGALHELIDLDTRTQETRLLSWYGTRTQTQQGLSRIITEYRHSTHDQEGDLIVRRIKVPHQNRAFSINLEYRQKQQMELRPICDRINASLRVAELEVN